MDYDVAKSLVNTLGEINKTLKNINKSITALAEVHGNTPPAEPECDFLKTEDSKEMYLCDAPGDCFFKAPREDGIFCMRFMKWGGTE